jgi:serine/threonine protein kinase
MATIVRPTRLLFAILLISCGLLLVLVTRNVGLLRPALEIKLICELNSGGFSKVYLGEVLNGGLDNPGKVAVKHVTIAKDQDDTELHALRNEARLLQLVQGPPYIIKALKSKFSSVSEDRPFARADKELQGDFYLVMEYVPGSIDLWEIIDQRALSVEEQKSYGRQMALMLQHLHKHDIVFGDFKIENVLCVGSVAKLIDFGSARIAHQPDDILEKSRPPSEYIRSPELLVQDAPGSMTFEDDVWALGIALYYIHHRRSPLNPYVSDDLSPETQAESDILRKRMVRLMDAYRMDISKLEFGPECPPELKDLLSRMLHPEKNQRLTDIDTILQHPWLQLASSSNSASPQGKSRRREDICKRTIFHAPIHLII